MRSLIAMIAVVVGVSQSLAQTLDSPFIFVLTSSRCDLSSYYQRAVAEATEACRGDVTGFTIVAIREFQHRLDSESAQPSNGGHDRLSIPSEFNDDHDSFPIFPIPPSALRPATALEHFIPSIW